MFLASCFDYCSRGRPTAFFPDIAPSRMFTTNSLCLIVCPLHEWRLFFKILKSNLSSFTFWKTSSFVILYVHFIFSILLQHHVSNLFIGLSTFFPRVHVSDPQRATLQITLYRFLFHFQTKVKEPQYDAVITVLCSGVLIFGDFRGKEGKTNGNK